MNVLVTGSAGLIGRQLIAELTKKNSKVVGYDINPTNSKANYIFEQGGLEDFPRLASIIKQHNIDSIVHTGGISHPIVGNNSPNQVIQTNIVGTNNVYEAARLFNIKKVIYLSSGAVYGNNKKNSLTEEEKPTPTNIYGVSKLTGEYIAEAYNRNYNLNIISLRLAFVYGAGRNMPDPIKFIIESAIKGKSINEDKGMDQVLEFIYIKDVVRAIQLALDNHEIDGEIFNIGSGQLTSISDILSIVSEKYPKLSITMGPGDMGYGDTGHFDCSKAKEVLQFETLYSLKDGILDYLSEITTK